MLAPTVIVQPSSRPSSTMGERDAMPADTSEEKHEPNVKEIVAPARLNVPLPDNKSESEDEEYQEVRWSQTSHSFVIWTYVDPHSSPSHFSALEIIFSLLIRFSFHLIIFLLTHSSTTKQYVTYIIYNFYTLFLLIFAIHYLPNSFP